MVRDALSNQRDGRNGARASLTTASRSIALGRRAIDEIGRSPENYRLYFPVLERETLISSSKENGLDPVLVAALIRQESNFNPLATSPVGARGLMQLMPAVGKAVADSKGIGPWDPNLLYEPATNIKLGTAHLSGLVRKYPEVVKVLAAYNAGESRVEKWSTKTGAETRKCSPSEYRSSKRATTCERSFAIAPTTRRSIPGRCLPGSSSTSSPLRRLRQSRSQVRNDE